MPTPTCESARDSGSRTDPAGGSSPSYAPGLRELSIKGGLMNRAYWGIAAALAAVGCGSTPATDEAAGKDNAGKDNVGTSEAALFSTENLPATIYNSGSNEQ